MTKQIEGLCPHGRHYTAVCLDCGIEAELYQPDKKIVEDVCLHGLPLDGYCAFCEDDKTDPTINDRGSNQYNDDRVMESRLEAMEVRCAHDLEGYCPTCSYSGKPMETTHPSREDIINSPMHYKVGGYEAIDVIRAKLTPEEFLGYCKGNVLKYLMRANYKGHHDNDIGKAEWYMKECKIASQDIESMESSTGAGQVRTTREGSEVGEDMPPHWVP